MSIVLENEFLTIKVEEKGAEIISIKDKKDGSEYIWVGESKFWGRHAPILFPIVGKLKDNSYRIGEKTYKLSQHGFARDMNFEVVENNNEKATFRLKWDEETLKNYPYKFELDVQYIIIENDIEVKYIVRNMDNDDIYFSIGAHPGFNCPIENSVESAFEDYYFEFEQNETLDVTLINADGLLKSQQESFMKDSNVIMLSKQLFEKDALIFQNLKSHNISIKNSKNHKCISMNFSGFPYLGLWSKPGGAPFVCIEPWLGHADYEDFQGDFREKEGVIKLSIEKEFCCQYSISFI